MAAYAVIAARSAGCAPLVVVCAPETAQLGEHVASSARCVVQSDENWLESAVRAIPDTVASIIVISGAMPLLTAKTLSQLADCQQETSAALVGFARTHEVAPPNDNGLMQETEGSSAPIPNRQELDTRGENEGSSSPGIVCVSRVWLAANLSAFKTHGDFSPAVLTECAAASDAPMETVHRSEAERELLQVRDRADLALAEHTVRERIRRQAMRGGVTLVDPTTAWIDDTVTFGQDVTILPNCHIYGETAIGDNCTIGPNSRVENSQLASNVTVVESVLEGAEVGANVRIGPFAHLRPGTILAHDVEIGNYAELKNTQVSPGAKIHHVGYLGDTVVGNDVNIGAGTITCNFDGAEKHATEIGEGAFVGSGTLLVAPVRVGSNAMTGAGSVVTRDVPASMRAYGVPARVRGMRALPEDCEPDCAE
jgi:bifunctional UDP-N-acetylglucosamine pyrophosphorylase/glucosamine-1-phosphate N-acetyltransferase